MAQASSRGGQRPANRNRTSSQSAQQRSGQGSNRSGGGSNRKVVAAKKSGTNRGLLWVTASFVVVAAIIATFVIIKANKSSGSAQATDLAPASVVNAVTNVPNTLLASATVPTSSIPLPVAVKNTPVLTNNAKPVVLYMGADYCPYCAAQRWPLIVALSKFGTFSNLHTTASSSTDVYPNTQTFSFYGSSYKSNYIDFQAVEMQTNVASSSGGYTTLQTPNAEQQKLFAKYDQPPYAATATGIPFIDFGNQYIESGPAYSPQILQGLSRASIAGSLSITGAVTSQAILASANLIIATVCKIDHNQPGSVCTSPAVVAAQKAF
ncbi:MAG: DUF929 family protein [Actinomycetota bacterium]|nr:DUF929 family protein [Actinomycetota bacterium]